MGPSIEYDSDTSLRWAQGANLLVYLIPSHYAGAVDNWDQEMQLVLLLLCSCSSGLD